MANAPSAPSLEFRDLAQDIIWDRPLTLGYLDSNSARRTFSCALTTLASLSFGGTVAAALYFTATPYTVIAVVSGLALLTLACAVAACWSCTLKPSQNETLMQNRESAAKEMEGKTSDERQGYFEWRARFPEDVISQVEANQLLSQDAHTKTYPEFYTKHGLGGLAILDEDNKEAVKQSYVADLHSKIESGRTKLGVKVLLELPESKYLGVTEQDLNQKAATNFVRHQMREAEHPGQYEEFVNANGEKAIGWITDSAAKNWLANCFLLSMMRSGKGLLTIEKEQKEALKLLPDGTLANLIAAIIALEIKSFENGKISFKELILRNQSTDPNSLYLKDYLRNRPLEQEKIENKLITFPIGTLRAISADYNALFSGFSGGHANFKLLIEKAWKTVQFSDPVEIRRRGLFDTVGIETTAVFLNAKAIIETRTMSVEQIPEEIFLKGIMTTEPRWLEELEKCKHLEDFKGIGYNAIFTCNLITKNNQKLVDLTKDFVNRHQELCVTDEGGSERARNCLTYLVQHALLPQNVVAARQKYNDQKAQLEEVSAKAAAVYQSSLQGFEAMLKQNEQSVEDNIKSATSEVEAQTTKVADQQKNIQKIRSDIASKNTEKLQFEKRMDDLLLANQANERTKSAKQAELRDIPNKLKPLQDESPKLSREISAVEDHISKTIRSEKGLLDNYIARKTYLTTVVELLKPDLDRYKKHAEVSEEVERLKPQVAAKQVRKAELQESLKQPVQVTGLVAAWSAAKPRPEQIELDMITALESNYEKAVKLKEDLAKNPPKKTRKEVEAEINAKSKEIEQQGNLIKICQENIATKIKDIWNASRYQEKIARFALLEKEIKALQDRQKALPGEIEQCEQTDNKNQLQYDREKQKLGQIKTQLKDIDDTFEATNKALDKAKTALGFAQMQLDALNASKPKTLASAKELYQSNKNRLDTAEKERLKAFSEELARIKKTIVAELTHPQLTSVG